VLGLPEARCLFEAKAVSSIFNLSRNALVLLALLVFLFRRYAAVGPTQLSLVVRRWTQGALHNRKTRKTPFVCPPPQLAMAHARGKWARNTNEPRWAKDMYRTFVYNFKVAIVAVAERGGACEQADKNGAVLAKNNCEQKHPSAP